MTKQGSQRAYGTAVSSVVHHQDEIHLNYSVRCVFHPLPIPVPSQSHPHPFWGGGGGEEWGVGVHQIFVMANLPQKNFAKFPTLHFQCGVHQILVKSNLP